MHYQELDPISKREIGRDFSRRLADELLQGTDDYSIAAVDEIVRLWKVGATQDLLSTIFVQNSQACPKTKEMVIQRIVKDQVPSDERQKIATIHRYKEPEVGRRLGLANTKEELKERSHLGTIALGLILYTDSEKRLILNLIKDPCFRTTVPQSHRRVGDLDWDKIKTAFNQETSVSRSKKSLKGALREIRKRNFR